MYDTLHSFFSQSSTFCTFPHASGWLRGTHFLRMLSQAKGPLRALLRRREILKNRISSVLASMELKGHYIISNSLKKKSFDAASPPELGTSSESWFQNPLPCCFRLCFQSSLSSSFDLLYLPARPGSLLLFTKLSSLAHAVTCYVIISFYLLKVYLTFRVSIKC